MLKIILASQSKVRKKILDENNILNEVKPSNVDEDVVKSSLLKEKASPEIISKNLAELKANKISGKYSDNLVLGADTAGGTSSTIQYLDSGNTNRVMLGAYATNIVVLSNRAANGEVQIRANTSTAGGAGELTIATFKDTSVDFLNAAELRATNIGNIFDLQAFLTFL